MRLSLLPLLLFPFSLSIIATNPESASETHALIARQGIGAAGGPVGPAPSVTQMSPTTIYMVRGPNGDKTPMPYTQLFSKVPEQWPSPTAGTIGLGTIQGVIGVVKTQSKRSVLPTDAAQVAEKVRVLGEIVKRKAKGNGNGGDPNAGTSLRVQMVGVVCVVGVVLGGLMV